MPAPAAPRDRPGSLLADLRAASVAVRRNRWLVVYAVLYVAVALGLAAITGDVAGWINYHLLLVGGGCTLLAFLAVRGTRDPAAVAAAAPARVAIRRPAAESLIVIVLVLAFVLVRTDQLLHGPFTTALFSLSSASWWDDWSLIGVKLLLNVALPIGIFLALGYRPREIGLRWGAGWRLWPLFLVAGAPKLLPALTGSAGPGAGVVHLGSGLVYYFLAAGWPEETVHRALLLPRLEAWWGSANAAIFAQAGLFALTHIPIRLMGTHDLLFIFGNLFLFVTGLGLLFGYVYRRTGAVFPVAWLHALIDAS